MNWTGGQLHRHSARKGVLSQNQRQKFAKSRQLATVRESRQPVHFPGFLNPTDELTVETERTEAEVLKRKPDIPPLNTTHLKSRGCQFLQDPNWASISVSRPLEIKFAPSEEHERFGKRRKLNDADHQRLSAAHGRLIPGLFQSRIKARGLPFERDTFHLDQIQIHIDGQPIGQRQLNFNASPGFLPRNRSSQSMLLDQSVPVTPRSPSQMPQINSQIQWQDYGNLYSGLGTQVEISRAPSTVPETVMLQNVKSPTPSRIPARSRLFHDMEEHHTIQHWRNTLVHPVPVSPVLSECFAADDKHPQKSPRSYSDTNQQDISRSLSLMSTLLAFPMNEKQIPLNKNTRRWQLRPRDADTRSTHHSLHDTDGGAALSGTRVFGQLIRVASRAGVSKLRT